MFFTLKEILRWLGVTIFEIFTYFVAFLVFTVLLTLKVEGGIDWSWFLVFAPLFAADALNAYFSVIVFIRAYIDGHFKTALVRGLWSLFTVLLLFLFKYFQCLKLGGGTALEYSEVLSPVLILLQFFLIRSCRQH